MKKKKQIIDLENQRYGLFMTENSFNLDIMYGRNYLQTDNAQEIILHRINVIETKSHNLYGQTKARDKKYMTPVRISVMVNVEDGKQENYGTNPGGVARDDTGIISFGVYLKELEEKKIEELNIEFEDGEDRNPSNLALINIEIANHQFELEKLEERWLELEYLITEN